MARPLCLLVQHEKDALFEDHLPTLMACTLSYDHLERAVLLATHVNDHVNDMRC